MEPQGFPTLLMEGKKPAKETQNGQMERREELRQVSIMRREAFKKEKCSLLITAEKLGEPTLESSQLGRTFYKREKSPVFCLLLIFAGPSIQWALETD